MWQSLNWRSIVFFLLPLILAIGVVMVVSVKTDLAAFIIAGDNAEEILLANEMQSGSLSKRYLLSVGAKQHNAVPDELITIFQERLRAIVGVVEVWSPGQQKDISKTLQQLYSHYAGLLYSLNPQLDLEKFFSPHGLNQRAVFLKNALLSPQGAMIKQIALRDPLLLTLKGFQSLSKKTHPVSIRNQSHQNFMLETDVSGLNAVAQSRIQQAIKTVFTHVNQQWQNQFQLEMTGVPVFAVATQKLIQGDITKVSIISSIALMTLFLLIFRSIGTLFQVFTLLAIVILASILFTQFSFTYVHGMTIAIGSTLVGICIDYPIHAIVHAQTVVAEQRAATVAKIWPSMLLGGVTTLVGYFALGASGYPGFQQIAVYAATGITIALLLTRYWLPSLVQIKSHRQLNLPLVNRWRDFCQRFRRMLIGILILTVGGSLFGLKSLHWLQDMQQLTPELNYLKENDQRIRSRMISIEPGRFILITAENTEAALQKSEQVYQVLDRLKRQGELTDYMGLFPWILSAKQQHQNQQRLTAYLTAKNQHLWQQSLHKNGLSIKRLGHFNYPAIEPLKLEQVLNTPVKRLLDSRIIVTDQRTMIMIWIAKHHPAVLQEALKNREGVQYFSQRDMLNAMMNSYTDKAKVLFLMGLAVISLILTARYRSLLKAIQTLLPAFLSVAVILGFWALTGAVISFLHLVAFLLVVAICVDYGIFYQENRGANIQLTYQAMAASMLTSALAFGSLAVAESYSLKILASIVTLGVVLGFMICPIVIQNDKKRV